MDYGFSKKMSPDDERQGWWEKQRRNRGFDDTELWCLSNTLARIIVDRLKAFVEHGHGYPSSLTSKEWDRILQKMIDGFEEMENYDDLANFDGAKVMKALKLFRKWFFDLWN